jgi:urea carboxylase
MEGPGGYQFVGRTVQMWNPHRQTADFTGGKPWLLRFFDQIRFYPVSATELLKMRQDFPLGRLKLDVTHETFSLRAYNQFLRDNDASITSFRTMQRQAFHAERERWERLGLSKFESATADDDAGGPAEAAAPGLEPVFSEVTGNLWKVLVKKGQSVREGERLAILESMKTEIEVLSPATGRVVDIFCEVGRLVSAGQLLFAVDSKG